MRTRVSIYGLAIQSGTEADPRILLTQLAPQCYRAGSWTLPGGGMDFGESPLQTLVREVHEESALQATEPELFHVHSFSEQTQRGPAANKHQINAQEQPTQRQRSHQRRRHDRRQSQ